MKKALLFTLLVILALSLAACGAPAEEAPAEEAPAETPETSSDFVTDGFCGITYSMPKLWSRIDEDDSSVSYQPQYSVPSLLSFWVENAGEGGSFEQDFNRKLYIAATFADASNEYEPLLTEDLTIAGCPGLHHTFSFLSSSGSYTEMDVYAFTSGTDLYCLTSMINSDAEEAVKKDLSDSLRQIVDSVTVGQ